jgi:ribosomal-protein-alanine N-acetyltransferase
MNSSMQLEGRRVTLRPARPGDAREFLALNRASVRFHRGRVSPPKTTADYRTFLKRCAREDVENFLITRREPPSIIGYLGLSQIFRGPFQNACLGYCLGAPFAGQGFMTEAVTLSLHHAFHNLHLHRVEANVQPENEASLRLLRRLGFRLEGRSPRFLKVCGRWRDHLRWAILAEEWRRLPAFRCRPASLEQ